MADYIFGSFNNSVTIKINKFNLSDLSYITESLNAGGLVSVLLTDGDYVYAAVDTPHYKIFKYNLSDLTYVGASPSYGGTIYTMAINGNYVYAGGSTTNKIRRYNLSDLTYVDESPSYGGIISGIAINGNYVYAGGYTTTKIRKYNLSDLTYTGVESAAYGAYINDLKTDSNYVYAGGYDRVIVKYNLLDLTTVATSPNYGNTIQALELNDNYIYAAGYANYIRKYNLSDLTYTGVESPSYGNYILTLEIDDSYIYAAGAGHGNIRKYNLSDLTYVSTSTPVLGVIGALHIYFDVSAPLPPSGLTVTGITYTDATLNWVNNANVGTNVIQQWMGSYWQNVATLPLSATTYNLTGLSPYTEYTYRVSLFYSSVYYPSNSVTFMTLMPLPSFCENAPFTVSGSTCGNSDGSVTIDNVDYHIFYDFVLTDVQGNVQALTGLTSGYYFLTATVKPEYWYWYGRETCTFEWLEVIDSDTTMSNTSKSVRNVICGGFGKQQGRIAYLCTDSGSNPIYTAKLYDKETYDLVQTVTGTTIDLIIFSPLNAGNYYLVLTNDAGCTLLVSNTQVQGQSLRSVAGIKKLWLTQWDENVEYDYWAQSDDDYYLSGIDADFFNSIKIKRFIDTTLPDVWYSVNVQTKAITFSQTMEKTKQGFVFNDKLTLTIPEADNTKWKELVDILQNRYILIFLDNNGYYWCMGYRHGASTDGYKRENNEYILEFNAISENKILTNIDKQYVIDSIL